MQTQIKTLLLILTTTVFVLASQANPNDFETVKNRVKAELLKTRTDDKKVEIIMDMMLDDGSFQDINYADLSRTAGFPQRIHTSNLVYIAKAYKNAGSKFYKSKILKEVIISGLGYWVKHDFFGDNWHNNQISTPTYLVNLMLLIGDELPKVLVEDCQPMIGRAHMNASGARLSQK